MLLLLNAKMDAPRDMADYEVVPARKSTLPTVAAAAPSADSINVVFCIDVSGSMSVSEEVGGGQRGRGHAVLDEAVLREIFPDMTPQ